MGKVVDAQGYRPNVGIVIANKNNQLFWAKRAGLDAWQFPQGGIRPGEELLAAMYRELMEETGIPADDVTILGQTDEWVRYEFGSSKTTAGGELYMGQKQLWFLVRFLGDDRQINLQSDQHVEFEDWRWVDYWYPLNHIVDFKRPIYEATLKHFAPLLFGETIEV